MKIEIVKSEAFKTTTWTGGTTTELFIHPEDADFKKRDFDFRLSKAKVDDEASVFTSLPDIKRKLMVLDGEITLKHAGQYSKKLSILDIDTFEGGWSTVSSGTCVDFNLMTKDNTIGDLAGLNIPKGTLVSHQFKTDFNFVFIYSYQGKTEVRINGAQYQLDENSILAIQDLHPLTMQLYGNEKSTLALVTISSH